MPQPSDPLPPPAGVYAAEAEKSVLDLGEGLDDHRLYAEFGHLNMLASDQVPPERLAAVEAYADLRFAGEQDVITIRAHGADRPALEAAFRVAHAELHRSSPVDARIQVVTLRIRRVARPE